MVSGNNFGSAGKSDLPLTSFFDGSEGHGYTQDMNTAMKNKEGDSGFDLRSDSASSISTTINPALEGVRELGAGGMGVVVLTKVIDDKALREQVPAFARQLTPNLAENHPERVALQEAILANINAVLAETRFVVAKIATIIKEKDVTSGTQTYAQGLTWREAKRQLQEQKNMPHGPRILGGQLDAYPVYFIQSYERGYDLQKLMSMMPKQGAAHLQTKLAILAQAARNVAQIAEAGLVHRDIKPSNFMMCVDGHVKTLDFGLARRVSDESMAMTQEGKGVGTIQYVAPEVMQGKTSITAKADIFSLGVMAVEQLTGRSPYKGANPTETAVKRSTLLPGQKPESVIFDHLDAEPPAVQRFVREALVPMLMRMIDPAPLRRPDPMEVAEFFHGHSYLAGRVSFEEFIDPASTKGALHLPRTSSKSNDDTDALQYETVTDMLAALDKGANERSEQYNFLDQYQSAEEEKSSRTVFSLIARKRRLISGVVGAAVLVGSAGAYLSRSDGQQKKVVPVPVTTFKPPVDDVPSMVVDPIIEQETLQKEPEIIDGGGEVAMRFEDGQIKDVRLFKENPVLLDKDLIPCYSMDINNERLTGAVFFCTPDKIMKIMDINNPSLLSDEQRQGVSGHYMQSFDGSSKFLVISGTLMMIEHGDRQFVYSDSTALLEARASALDVEARGPAGEFIEEVSRSDYALGNIPLMMEAEGKVKPYWPEKLHNVSLVDLQNQILQYYQHVLSQNHEKYQVQEQTAGK